MAGGINSLNDKKPDERTYLKVLIEMFLKDDYLKL